GRLRLLHRGDARGLRRQGYARGADNRQRAGHLLDRASRGPTDRRPPDRSASLEFRLVGPVSSSKRIAVIGAGLVGRAWAIVFARAGHDVAFWDQDAAAPPRALGFIESVLPELA